MTVKSIPNWICVSLFAVHLYAQSPASAPVGSSETLSGLRERIAQQEEELKRLQQALEEERAMLEKATGNPPAAAAPSTPAPTAYAEKPSPLSIHIGSAALTPFGFVDFTYFGRSTNVGSGIGTSFGSIPYNNSYKGYLSENNLSTQNSRIGFRVDSGVLGAKVLGYFEADFLGTAPDNVFVTSNSSSFRMRNIFVDVQKNGLEIVGGQDWSMFTPNRKGLSPLPTDIFYTQDMDTNYQAGLVWARQSQVRVIAHPSEDFAFGVSLENPQQFAGNGVVAFPAALAASAGAQFNNTASGYSIPNLHPDVIIKAAYDGHAGGQRAVHFEAGALIRSFRTSFPLGMPAVYKSSAATAASGEVDASLDVAKHLKLIANTFFGSGGGRYLFGLGPDVIVRADGSLSPVHAYSTLDGFEANVTKNTLIDAYYGGAYFGRNVALDTNGTPIGYGYFKSPNSDNRTIQEATFGLTRNFWKSANYGALSLITQYSYLWRNPWFAAPGSPKNARTNVYYVNLRYTLP